MSDKPRDPLLEPLASDPAAAPGVDVTIEFPSDLPSPEILLANAGDVQNWMDNPPLARQWLIRDLIPANEIGRLVAPGGTGKSMALLQLAVSVASGAIPWLGFAEPGLEATHVLVLSAEDDLPELHRRFYAIGKGLREAEQLLHPAVCANIVPVAVRGMDLRLVTTAADGSLARDTKRLEWLIALIERTGAQLLTLDPQSSFYGGEENSNRDAQLWIDTLRHVTARTGVTILICHHANKASMNGTGDGGVAARGASAFRDGCRFELNLAGMSDTDAKNHGLDSEDRGRYVRLSLPKGNYSAPFPGVWLERGPGGFLTKSDIAPVAKSKASSPELRDAIVAVIAEKATQKQYYSKRSFCRSLGGNPQVNRVGRDTLDTAVSVLIEEGVLALKPPPEQADFGYERPPRVVLTVVS